MSHDRSASRECNIYFFRLDFISQCLFFDFLHFCFQMFFNF